MNSQSRSIQGLVWGLLGIVILSITGAFFWSKLAHHGAAKQSLPVLGSVPEFTLTNQSGERVSLEMLRGKVWLADIIFTQCAGPCPEMSHLMSQLQAALPASSPLKLISLTTDPEFDTPVVLKRYGERFNADPARWMFLTGEKKEIYHLAVDGLKLALVEKRPEERATPEDLFVHSTVLALVDKQGQMRAVFESLGPGSKEKILSTVRTLLREK